MTNMKKNLHFSILKITGYRPTDRRTDRRTDRPSYKDARMQKTSPGGQMDASASVMDQYMTSVYQLSFQCFSDRQTHGRTDLRTSPLRRTHLKIVKPRQKHIFKHKQHSHRKCNDPVSRYCLPAACSYLSLAYRELRS